MYSAARRAPPVGAAAAAAVVALLVLGGGGAAAQAPGPEAAPGPSPMVPAPAPAHPAPGPAPGPDGDVCVDATVTEVIFDDALGEGWTLSWTFNGVYSITEEAAFKGMYGIKGAMNPNGGLRLHANHAPLGALGGDAVSFWIKADLAAVSMRIGDEPGFRNGFDIAPYVCATSGDWYRAVVPFMADDLANPATDRDITFLTSHESSLTIYVDEVALVSADVDALMGFAGRQGTDSDPFDGALDDGTADTEPGTSGAARGQPGTAVAVAVAAAAACAAAAALA